MKKLLAGLVVLGIITTGAIALPAISAGTSKTILGCVNKKTGVLRVAKTCSKSETRLSWSSQGPEGKQGLQGLPGLNGSGGSSALNFSSNCYQWLNQAESAGFMWTLPADKSRFETLTGCTIREIDLNPNSQFPRLYSTLSIPRVLTSKLVAVTSASGDGDNTDGYYQFFSHGVYEVTLSKPEGQEICSSNLESRRVFVSPVNQKTYVIGELRGNQRGATADLFVSSGEVATSVVRRWNYGNNGSYYSTLESGTVELTFEPLPESIPLGLTAKMRLLSVMADGEQIDASDYQIFGYGNFLTKVLRLPDESGAEAVFNIEANSSERGLSNLDFRIDISTPNYGGSLDFRTQVHVGVRFCGGVDETEVPEMNTLIPVTSNMYRIRETSNIPQGNPAFLDTIGWVRWRWFEPEPGYFTD